jgi:hypothetical protein
LTWGRVILQGIAGGAMLGLFIGMLASFVVTPATTALLMGVVGGIIFGVVSSAIPYAMMRGQRDFASTMQLVAGRYDILCDPATAERGRDMLARLSI